MIYLFETCLFNFVARSEAAVEGMGEKDLSCKS